MTKNCNRIRRLPILLLGLVCSTLAANEFCARCNMAFIGAGEGDGLKYAPDRLVDIRHLKLEITPDFQKHAIQGIATLDFSPISEPVTELTLYGVDLAVSDIKGSSGVRAWVIEEPFIKIHFKEPLPVGKPADVRISYSAVPEEGLYFRTENNGWPAEDTHFWTQGEPEMHRHWFPSHDYPNEKFTTEVLCHVPDGMVVLSNGRQLEGGGPQKEGLKTYHWLQDKPHSNYLVSIVAGYLKKLEDRHRDIPLAFFTPPTEFSVAANSFRDTRDIMAFFEQEIGVLYPWDKYYNVCVHGFNWGGMENTSVTTLNTSTLFPEATENLRSSRGLDAHELAHQWFGDLVTCKDWTHIWLNEGFATYYAALYDKHREGDQEFKYGMWQSAVGVLRNKDDAIPVANRDYQTPESQFSFRAYPKGAWVLHMLRNQVGDQLFRECVRVYLQRNQYQNVVTQDLLEVFEELSGKSLDRFFDQWIFQPGTPSLKVQYGWNENEKLARLTVSQTQKVTKDRPLFQLPVPVVFKLGDQRVAHLLHVSRESEDFYLPLEKAPDLVRLDPEVTVLADIDFTPNRQMLLLQLQDREDHIGRILALEKLAQKRDADTIELLKKTLQTDSFYGVREKAAEELADMKTPEALDALIESVNQSDARVRRQVVRGLGRFYHPNAMTAMKRVAEHETNPDILSMALSDLGKYESPSIRGVLLHGLDQESYKNRIATGAIEGMKSFDQPELIDPLLSYLEGFQSRFTPRGFAGGLGTLAFLARNEDDKSVVRRFLVKFVNDKNRDIQLGAIRALGDLQDEKAIPVVESLAAGDREKEPAKTAGSTLSRLKERRAPSAQITELKRLVEELRDEVKSARNEVDALRVKWEATRQP